MSPSGGDRRRSALGIGSRIARRGAVRAAVGAVLAFGVGACGGSSGASIGSSMTLTDQSGHNAAAVTLTHIVDPAQPAPGSGVVLLENQPGQKILDLVFSVRVTGTLIYQDTPKITLPLGPDNAYTTSGGNLSTDFTDSSSADAFEALPNQTTTICVSFVVPTAFHPTEVKWVPDFGRATSTLTWSVPRGA